MIGAFTSSVFSDRFGRKPVFMVGQILMMLVGVINAFLDNFYVFLVSKFIIGLLQQASIFKLLPQLNHAKPYSIKVRQHRYEALKSTSSIICFYNISQTILLCGFIMVSELFSSRQRTFAGSVSQVTWGLNAGLLAILAYFLTNWVHLQLAISLSGLACLPLFWFFGDAFVAKI